MGNKFMVRCIRCGAQGGLQMVPHRVWNCIVGWVFACRECAPFIYGSRIAIRYPPFEDDEK